MAQLPTKESQPEPKKARVNSYSTLSFSKEDKIGTTQPHDDALLITLRIRDYDVKRVMVDGGSAAEIMYPDLYKKLKLKPENLMPYSSPLMSFDRKLVILKGMIRLPIQTGPEIMEVNFIVVDTYSPYTAIISRPWLHTLGVVASSLHQKVKFLSRTRSSKSEVANPRQGSVWWLPSHIGSMRSPQPLWKRIYSSQKPRC